MVALPDKPLRCPVCGKTFPPATSTAIPFCSERCRRIDLGRWLGEDYVVPVEKPQEGGSEEEEEE